MPAVTSACDCQRRELSTFVEHPPPRMRSMRQSATRIAGWWQISHQAYGSSVAALMCTGQATGS
jgi:hypothetical protein